MEIPSIDLSIVSDSNPVPAEFSDSNQAAVLSDSTAVPVVKAKKVPANMRDEWKKVTNRCFYSPDFVDKIKLYYDNSERRGVWAGDAGAAAWLGCSKRSFFKWMEDYPDFKEAIHAGRARAEACLHEGALKEKFNPQYARFLAINSYGFLSENSVQKTEATLKGGIQIQFVKPESQFVPLVSTDKTSIGGLI